MAVNQIKQFAGSGGANVLTPTAYAALATLLANGFSSGVAPSVQLNTVWRQSSFMAAMLAQFIADQTGLDVNDDGNVAGLEANLVTALNAVAAAYIRVDGQCRLAKSGANLVLSPYNGNKIVIAGVMQSIPSAGVSLAPPATTLTLYYIYAYMAGATMTLEASATGHSTDTTTGVEIKTGDNSRTLVGMARTVTNAWVNTVAQRFVIGWFNRRPLVVSAAFTTNRSTSSTTPVELNAEIQNQFLTWGDELAESQFNGVVTLSGTAGQTALTNIGVDSTTVNSNISASYQRDTNSNIGTAQVNNFGSLSEGYHYTTVLGYVSASSASWATSNVLTTKIKG